MPPAWYCCCHGSPWRGFFRLLRLLWLLTSLSSSLGAIGSLLLGSFLLLSSQTHFTHSQSWNQSWIIFASLYGKTPYARNGNYSCIFFRSWEFLGKPTSTNLYAIPLKGKKLRNNFHFWELRPIFFPFLGIQYTLYEEFQTNFSTNGNLSLPNFRFGQHEVLRTNWQKRCTIDSTTASTWYIPGTGLIIQAEHNIMTKHRWRWTYKSLNLNFFCGCCEESFALPTA